MGLSTEVGRQEGRPGEVFWKPRGCLHVVTPPPPANLVVPPLNCSTGHFANVRSLPFICCMEMLPRSHGSSGKPVNQVVFTNLFTGF